MQTAIDLGAPPPDQDLNWGDLTAGELLRRIRNTSRTEAEKGQWFENLFAQLARNEPGFELEGVWRWAQWPERKRLTGLSGQDIGVDLVALHRDGTWIAIQCKCYAFHHRVTKADVQSFLAGSLQEIFGLRWIVTTSRWGRTAENLIHDTNVRRIDFRSYQDRRVTAKEVKRPVRDPWPLQQEAIDSVLQGLEHHDRGRLIMACGTGKTFTALRIAERFVPAGEAILFLAPTIALVSQARREWLTHTTRPLSSLVVCSDPYAGGRNEQEDISISELECPVVSKPEEVAAKLRSATQTKVVFCTYQSLLRISEAQERYGVEPFALRTGVAAHAPSGRVHGAAGHRQSSVDGTGCRRSPARRVAPKALQRAHRKQQAGEQNGRRCMTEITFEVTEDEVDGGYSASALGHGIHTEGDSVEELRRNVKEAVDCYFDDTMPQPKLIRLHFVRDEVLVA